MKLPSLSTISQNLSQGDDLHLCLSHSTTFGQHLFTMSAAPSNEQRGEETQTRLFRGINGQGPLARSFAQAWDHLKRDMYPPAEVKGWGVLAFHKAEKREGILLRHIVVLFSNSRTSFWNAPESWNRYYKHEASYATLRLYDEKESPWEHGNSIFCSDPLVELADPTAMSEDELRTYAQSVASEAWTSKSNDSDSGEDSVIDKRDSSLDSIG
jgi:hypothetical protein